MMLLAQEILVRESWLERLVHPPVIICFFIFGLPVVVWGIRSIVAANAKAKVLEAELQLKRELVAQGRPANEIMQILGKSTSSQLDD